VQPINEGFILSTVVERLVVDLHDTLQVFTLKGDEEYACSRSFEVHGNVEVHLPVLDFFRQVGLMCLCPLRDELRDELGLNGMPWA
jgi:hypothetical protein